MCVMHFMLGLSNKILSSLPASDFLGGIQISLMAKISLKHCKELNLLSSSCIKE